MTAYKVQIETHAEGLSTGESEGADEFYTEAGLTHLACFKNHVRGVLNYIHALLKFGTVQTEESR